MDQVPQAAQRVVPDASPEQPDGGGGGTAPCRILLVQNADRAQQACRVNLELEGFSVQEAANGEQALRAARKHPLDLIILDLALPVRDGWDVLGELKTDEILRSIPVVILTASAEETNELQARERGAIAFLAKPIAVDDLMAAIRRALSEFGRLYVGKARTGQARDPLGHLRSEILL